MIGVLCRASENIGLGRLGREYLDSRVENVPFGWKIFVSNFNEGGR